jgi:hypothetical protein
MKKAAAIIISSVAFAVLVLYLFNKSILVMSEITLPGMENEAFWHKILNTQFNIFFQWKIAWLTSTISTLLYGFLKNSRCASDCVSAVVFFAGTLLYFSSKTERFRISNLFLALCLTISLLLLFRGDSTVIHALSFSFWVLFFSERFLKNPAFFSLESAALFISLYLLFDSANQLAPFVTGFIFCIAALNTPGGSPAKFYCMASIVSLFVISTATSPLPTSPNYPAFAHVVPDDNLPGNVTPLIGPYPIIPFINREILKQSMAIPSAIVFLASLIFWALYRKIDKRSHLLLFISLCCMLDSFFSENISVISPVYVINRLIPGLMYFSLLPLFLACWSLLFAILASDLARNAFLASLLLLVFSLTGNKKTYEEKLLTVAPDILVSPSFNVIAEAGPAVMDNRDRNYSYIKLSEDDFESISSSENSDPSQFRLMFDEKSRTRWSTGTGVQKGNEWINLRFKNVLRFRGVFLDTGVFSADFPRGLEFEASNNCTDYFTIYQAPSWEGTISFTSDGFPYYENQSTVKAIFDHEVDPKCLRIKQTAKNGAFDWSIAEIQIIN